MGTSALHKGAKVAIDGQLATLLRKISERLWQVEYLRSGRIAEYTDEQLQELYVAGQLRFTPDSGSPPLVRSAEAPPSQGLERAKVRRLYAKAVAELPNTEIAFIPVILATWQSLRSPPKPPNWTTVYRWKTRYLESGRDLLALVDNVRAKGNRTPRLEPEVTELARRAIEESYLQPERRTITDTLNQAISLVTRENKLRPALAQLRLPTRRHITTLIQAIPAFDRYAARYGRMAAIRRFRSVQAHRTTAAPLERAEIDHTPLDLMVIDDDSVLPLGRPYVTACIDDYSRCVLGIYISFEPPSHFTVSRCLKIAFLPKSDLLRSYPNITHPWSAHGVMRDLVVDNGQEFHSESLENLCYSLGIEIHYSPRKTPWFKGKIERFLGTLNRAVAHGIPGTTFGDVFEKDDYVPSECAVVRYSVLKEIVHTWIADVYHQQVHRTLGATPAEVWAQSIRPEDILIPDDPLRLDVLLGQSEVRVLSHKGIELYGLQYNSPDLTTLRRTIGEKFEVEVRVDRADLGHITVLSPDRTTVFKVRCLQFDYANGLSEWQHRVCKRFAIRTINAHDPQAWLAAKERIRDLVENEFMVKKQRTRSKIARFKNIDASAANGPAAIVATPEVVAPAPETALAISARIPAAMEFASESPKPRRRRIVPLHRDRNPLDIFDDTAE